MFTNFFRSAIFSGQLTANKLDEPILSEALDEFPQLPSVYLWPFLFRRLGILA